MKVLFLDIDGVLNSTRTWVAFGGLPHEFKPGLPRFDLVAIGMLRRIVRAAGAQVVLSSAWRTTHTPEEAAAALGLPIVSSTPVGRCAWGRGQEIAEWLRDHAGEVEAYCILDDDADMLPEQRPYFVQTSGHEGLTYANAARVAELLGVSIHDSSPSRMPAPVLPDRSRPDWHPPSIRFEDGIDTDFAPL